MNKVLIAEIAGKDSISAINKIINSIDCQVEIVPTIVYTGTEYGRFDSYKDSIDYLKGINNHNVIFDKTYELHDEVLWNVLAYKYQYLLFVKYGFFTPCIMCHFYTHFLRIPLYIEKKASGLISGERISHDGKTKLNQHKLVLDCFRNLFGTYSIDIIQPNLEIDETRIIDNIIKNIEIRRGANDLKCVLSNNLVGFNFDDQNNMSNLKSFLNDFVLPIGHYCLNEMKRRHSIDISALDLKIKENLDE